ncbi:hypothetical protein [Helicobacter equorum]|uniref:hypothetical protein n=1 Tax=Helicobacter equorum TaxID=361872 RepID=UPI000CF094E8|nr:hypothetical protein [Helicobacter equorum]
MYKKEYQKQFKQGLQSSTGAKLSNYLAVNLFNTQSKQQSNPKPTTTPPNPTTTPPKSNR